MDWSHLLSVLYHVPILKSISSLRIGSTQRSSSKLDVYKMDDVVGILKEYIIEAAEYRLLHERIKSISLVQEQLSLPLIINDSGMESYRASEEMPASTLGPHPR